MTKINPARWIRVEVLHLTQAQLAEKLGVRQPSVFRWERARAFPAAMQPKIRELGKAARPDWSDSWFFEPPAQAEAAA